MFIARKIFVIKYNFQFQIDDVITISIKLIVTKTKNHYLHVHNVYNESDIQSNPTLIAVKKTLKIRIQKNIDEYILIKNFNIHHSSWKKIQTRTDNKSKKIFNLINDHQLTFKLSSKTTIYFHFQKSKLIINLCLIISNLTKRVFTCKIRFDLNHDLNHLFIETIFDIIITTAF